MRIGRFNLTRDIKLFFRSAIPAARVLASSLLLSCAKLAVRLVN